MKELLGYSIYEEAQILKAIKDKSKDVRYTLKGNVLSVELTNRESYIAGGNRITYSPIKIPLNEKQKANVSEITYDELTQYAFEMICEDVLGELGDFIRTPWKNGTFTTLIMEGGYKAFASSGLVANQYREFGEIIDLMAEYIEPFPAAEMTKIPSESVINNVIYASAVSRMRHGNNHLYILSSIYNLAFPDDRGERAEYSTSFGKARSLAKEAIGYKYASERLDDSATIKDVVRAKIEGINLINRLYTEMVREGSVKPFQQQVGTKDIYGRVSENWTKYIDRIIGDAKKVHDEMEPEDIRRLGDKSELKGLNGFWYPEAPWRQYNETVTLVRNPEQYNAANSNVSFAIANHYLDEIPISWGEDGKFHLLSGEGERNLAAQLREQKLGIIETNQGNTTERQSLADRYHRQREELGLYVEKMPRIRGVSFRRGPVERLKAQMITGLTTAKEGHLEIDGELFVSTDIGTVRRNQEDAGLILKDVDIPGLKMMLVADGLGGVEKGELASNYVTETIRRWFESLNYEDKIKYYKNPNLAKPILEDLIKRTSRELCDQYQGKSQTTLVCALIGENETIVENVGDSIGYIIKDGKLSMVTTDDSRVQQLYDNNIITTRDAMRFHKDSYLVTQSLGDYEEPVVHYNNFPIRNVDYDMLVIASDGVTDCLSEDEIVRITSETDSSNPAKRLVESAIGSISVAPDVVRGNANYKPSIYGGKDNTTAAVFVNKKNKRVNGPRYYIRDNQDR